MLTQRIRETTADHGAAASPGVRVTAPRARSTGLAVTAAGVLVFNVAPLMDWAVRPGDASPRTGFETDSLIPWIAYLGLGLLVALAYAGKRAYHGSTVA